MDDLLNILQSKHVETPIVDNELTTGYAPKVKRTVTYIVAGLIFNGDEVLLMQEAKRSCWGLWYLPAGKMEPNETIEEAVRREVQEETGMICHLDFLVSIEMLSHQWFRFNMMCSIQGGKLKTKADGESLQAKWFPVSEVLDRKIIKLRSSDIIQVVKEAHYFYKNQERMFKIRPINMGHHHLLMRLIIVFYSQQKSEFHILLGDKPVTHLPTLNVGMGADYNSFLKTTFRECQMNLKSVLSLEYNGKPKHANDGICISVLASVTSDLIPELSDPDRFRWLNVTDRTALDVLSKILLEFEGPRIVS